MLMPAYTYGQGQYVKMLDTMSCTYASANARPNTRAPVTYSNQIIFTPVLRADDTHKHLRYYTMRHV